MTVKIRRNNEIVNGIAVFEACGIRHLSDRELAAVNGGAFGTFLNKRGMEVSDSQRCFVCGTYAPLSQMTCSVCGHDFK